MTEVFVLFLALCIAICGVVVSISFWMTACNAKTAYQKLRMAPAAGDLRFWEKMKAVEAVSYDAHLWALLTFRDPMRLYDPILFEEAGDA